MAINFPSSVSTIPILFSLMMGVWHRAYFPKGTIGRPVAFSYPTNRRPFFLISLRYNIECFENGLYAAPGKIYVANEIYCFQTVGDCSFQSFFSGIRSIDDSAFMSYYQGLYGNGVSGWIREDTHPTGPQPVRELCELHVVEVQKQRIAQHRRGAGKGRICPIRIGQSPLLENEYGFRSVLVEYA